MGSDGFKYLEGPNRHEARALTGTRSDLLTNMGSDGFKYLEGPNRHEARALALSSDH
jgi:hypothetical protein